MIGRRSSLGCLHCSHVSIQDASRTVAMDFPDSDSAIHAIKQGNRAHEGDLARSANDSSTEPEPLLASLASQTAVVTDSFNPDSFSSGISSTPSKDRWWTSLAVIGISLLLFLSTSFGLPNQGLIFLHPLIPGR